MEPVTQLEQFVNLYFTHPYWTKNEISETSRIRFSFLPSKWLISKAGAARASEAVAFKPHDFKLGGLLPGTHVVNKPINYPKILQLSKNGWDIYYFCNASSADLKGYCRNQDILSRLFVPLDLDFRLPCSIEEFIDELGVRPACVVCTSRREGISRYQLLFGLEGDGSGDEGATESPWDDPSIHKTIKSFNLVCGSDNVSDARRILRLPGTINWKGYSKGDPLQRVELVSFDTQFHCWSVRDFSEAAARFGASSLGKEIAVLSREIKRQKGVSFETADMGSDYDYGTWETALEHAQSKRPVCSSGGRHNALLSWAGQMVRERLEPEMIFSNLRLLAHEACSPPYDDARDYSRMEYYVEQRIQEVEEEDKNLFAVIGKYETKELEGSEGAPTNGTHVPAPEIVKAANEAVASQVHTSIPLVERLQKSLESHEGESLQGFRKTFTRLLLEEERISALVIALDFMRRKDFGDENQAVSLLVHIFRELDCYYGGYFSARAEIKTLWGSVAKYTTELKEEELKGVIRYVLRMASAWTLKNQKILAKMPTIKEWLQNIDEDQRKKKLRFSASNRVIRAIFEGIKDWAPGRFAKRKTQPRNIIVFQNGIYNLADNSFVPDELAPFKHSNPVWVNYVERSRQLPIEALESFAADCPHFAKYLSDSFPGDPGTWELVLRIIGYCSTTDTSLHKIFVLEGVGGSGKSTLAAFISHVIGAHNFFSARYEMLTQKESLAGCVGKIFCAIEEAENDGRTASNECFKRLKQATSGQAVSIRSLYKDEISIYLPTKFMLITNPGIEFRDSGGAGERRLVPLKFEHALLARDMKPDVEFQKLLLSEADLVVSYAVRAVGGAWGQAFELFDISESRALREGRLAAQEHINPISSILHEIVVITDNVEDVIPSKIIYAVAHELLGRRAREAGHQRLDKTVSAELKKRGVEAPFMTKKEQYQFRAFKGVKLILDSVMDRLDVRAVCAGLPEDLRYLASKYYGLGESMFSDESGGEGLDF